MKTKKNSENEQHASPQPDPRQKRSVLWIGLIFFISGWVFFLGVMVGRGTAPALFDYKKIETEISVLAKAFKDKQQSQNDLETTLLTNQEGLDYAVELKKKTEDAAKMPMPAQVNPVRPAETPKPVPHEPAQAPSPPPAKPDIQSAAKAEITEPAPDAIKTGPEIKIKSMYDVKASQSRETVPERTAPSAPERTAPIAPERTPAAVPKPQPPASDTRAAASQPVTIHLTSLVDRKSADALIESLKSKGIPATKSAKMVQGKGIWYRVVVGKYTSPTEAEAMLNRLRQENVDASLVKQ